MGHYYISHVKQIMRTENIPNLVNHWILWNLGFGVRVFHDFLHMSSGGNKVVIVTNVSVASSYYGYVTHNTYL